MTIEAYNPHLGNTAPLEHCHTDVSYYLDGKMNLMMAISIDPVYDMECGMLSSHRIRSEV